MLDIRLLGLFDVRLDGRPVDLPTRPVQSLFAYLVLHPSAAQRRERLAGLFWPESTEAGEHSNPEDQSQDQAEPASGTEVAKRAPRAKMAKSVKHHSPPVFGLV